MLSFKKSIKVISTLSVILLSANANSAIIDFDVSAIGNSVIGGAGRDTGLTFSEGESITGSVNENDYWSANPSRGLFWSNANGLIEDVFATGSDESGKDAGVRIGRQYPRTWSHNGLTTTFGTLVGAINNTYFVLGTDFDIVAPESGTLSLFYWDNVADDNAGLVTVSIDNNAVSNVPVPAAVWLFGSGLVGLIGVNRKKAKLSTVS